MAYVRAGSRSAVGWCSGGGVSCGIVAAALFGACPAFAQGAADGGGGEVPPAEASESAAAPVAPPPVEASGAVPPAAVPPHSGFTVGAGLKASTLGAGFDLAVPVTHNTNVRLGYSGLIDIDHHFSKDNIDYQGKVDFHSADLFFDYFPFSGVFHLSAGLTYGSIFKVHADASAPGGSQFSLNGTTYTSSDEDPVTGNAHIDFRKVAPMVTLGWGNLVPRQGRLSLSFEIGAVFQGSGRSHLDLAGSACEGDAACPTGTVNVASDPTVQANIAAEQGKLDHEVRAFDVFPVISFGLGYRI